MGIFDLFRKKKKVSDSEKQETPTPIANPRSGWEEQFALMAKEGDDKLLIDDVFEDEEIA